MGALPRSASPRGPLPELTAARCAHGLIEQASCRACVDACPRGAWQLDDEMLGIDPERCDGCGLCAAACPPAAIRPIAAPCIRRSNRGPVALACCPRSGVPGDTDGLVPCLHGLSTRQLLGLHREGAAVLVTSSGDCNDCERGQAPRLQERLGRINEALEQRGLRPLKHGSLSAPRWHGVYLALSRGPGPASPDRRQWLRAGLTAAGRWESGDQGAGAEWVPPGTLVPRTGPDQILPRVPVIDPRACTGCDACVHACPERAIRLEDAATAYRFLPEDCSGCGLCTDVCTTQAVRVTRWGPVLRDTLPLLQGGCRACGAKFHRPEAGSPLPSLCPVCERTHHHLRLYQVLAD